MVGVENGFSEGSTAAVPQEMPELMNSNLHRTVSSMQQMRKLIGRFGTM